MYDIDQTGQIKPDEMKFILNALNNSVAYYGDEKKLSSSDIDALVVEVFQESDTSHTGTLSLEEYANAVTKHPILSHYM